MAQSMFKELLKTPQQVREERLAKMREDSAAQAALLSRGSAGSTALPGLLRGFAAQQLVEQGPIAENLVRRGLLGLSSLASVPQREIMASTSRVDPETLEPIGGGERVGTGQMAQRYPELAGALARASMSPEEQQAAVTSSIARQAGTDDPEKLRALADRLRKANRPDAAEQFDERATKLETEAREQAAKQALTQDLINAGTAESRKLAVAYAAGELTYNQVLEQMEKLGIQSFSLTGPERTMYQEFAAGNPMIAADLEYLSRGEPGFLRSLFGIPGATEPEIANYILLKAGELSERYLANEGKGKTKEEGLAWALKQLSAEKQKKEAQAIQRKKDAQTPMTIPGLNTVNPNEGIPEDQLNIGGA